jgi:hypothetical protein
LNISPAKSFVTNLQQKTSPYVMVVSGYLDGKFTFLQAHSGSSCPTPQAPHGMARPVHLPTYNSQHKPTLEDWNLFQKIQFKSLFFPYDRFWSAQLAGLLQQNTSLYYDFLLILDEVLNIT